jgi:hypothetical protein
MTWLQRYRVRHDVANAIGILPLLSRVAAIGAVPFFHWIEEAMGLGIRPPPGYRRGGAICQFPAHTTPHGYRVQRCNLA